MASGASCFSVAGEMADPASEKINAANFGAESIIRNIGSGTGTTMKRIRKAKLTEIAEIKKLLDSAAESGNVLRRPLMELYENVRDFYTYVDELGLVGCCALHIDTVDLAEVRSLVVRPDKRGDGIGKRLLEACLEEARALEISRVYALTRNTAFFSKNGFSEVPKQDLPHKVFNDCVRCPSFPDCDEVAMVRDTDKEEKEAVNTAKLDGKLGFIGFGNMGGAIAKGLLGAGVISGDRVYVYDPAADKSGVAAAFGVHACGTPDEVMKESNTVLLAVKPQMMEEVLAQLRPALCPDTLIITIAAGISIKYIQDRLGENIRVIRVMPNTPALVSEGAAGIAPSDNTTSEDVATARKIFEAVGVAETVPENLINAVTGVSGSGPAYFFYLVECLVNAAVAHGIPEHQAVRLAGQTLLGSGKLLMQSGESPAVLRERVTSKGGTTAAALDVFRAGDFEQVITAGVDAAVARAKELGK